MAKPELGTKRTCPECEARFYDLGKMPCECPKCEHSFEPEILLKSKKRVVEAEKPKPKPKPKPVEADSDDDDEEETGVEEVTAEGMVKMPVEVDEDGLAVVPDGDDDDEAGIAEIDVDLAANDDDDDNEDDNTTLVNFDDDEGDVAATIVPDLDKTKDE